MRKALTVSLSVLAATLLIPGAMASADVFLMGKDRGGDGGGKNGGSRGDRGDRGHRGDRDHGRGDRDHGRGGRDHGRGGGRQDGEGRGGDADHGCNSRNNFCRGNGSGWGNGRGHRSTWNCTYAGRTNKNLRRYVRGGTYFDLYTAKIRGKQLCKRVGLNSCTLVGCNRY